MRTAGTAAVLVLLLLVGGGLGHSGDHELRSAVETAFGLPELHELPGETLGFAARTTADTGRAPACPLCLSRLQQTGNESLPADLPLAIAAVERCPAPAAERPVRRPRHTPTSRGPPRPA